MTRGPYDFFHTHTVHALSRPVSPSGKTSFFFSHSRCQVVLSGFLAPLINHIRIFFFLQEKNVIFWFHFSSLLASVFLHFFPYSDNRFFFTCLPATSPADVKSIFWIFAILWVKNYISSFFSSYGWKIIYQNQFSFSFQGVWVSFHIIKGWLLEFLILWTFFSYFWPIFLWIVSHFSSPFLQFIYILGKWTLSGV